VVDKFVLQLEAQLADRNVTIDLADEASEWLIQHGYDEQMGARPMSRVIQEYIKKPLSDVVLFGKLKDGGHVRVVLKTDEKGEKSLGFEYPEGPITPRPEKVVAKPKRKRSRRMGAKLKVKKPGGSGTGGPSAPKSGSPVPKVPLRTN
jgi:ATP-dependent Clp protease ATP-binding subunit ClpA